MQKQIVTEKDSNEMLAASFDEVTDSDVLEVKLLKKVLRAIDKERVPSIEVLNGSFAGKKFFIADDAAELTIGRDENCDLPVEEYVISRRHAKVSKKDGLITLTDLNSKNGTFVNNHRITEMELHDGDRIALGTIVFIYRNPKEVDINAFRQSAKKNAPADPEPAQPSEDGVEPEEYFADAVIEETPDEYPAPRPRRERLSLSYFEMGMIGFGILIGVFALISLVNLIK